MPRRNPINGSRMPELMRFVAVLLRGGGHRSTSEVIQAGLRLLRNIQPVPAEIASEGPQP